MLEKNSMHKCITKKWKENTITVIILQKGGKRRETRSNTSLYIHFYHTISRREFGSLLATFREFCTRNILLEGSRSVLEEEKEEQQQRLLEFPSEWHSWPGERRLIKRTTSKTFCPRFNRFSLSLSLSRTLLHLSTDPSRPTFPRTSMDIDSRWADADVRQRAQPVGANRKRQLGELCGGYRCHRWFLPRSLPICEPLLGVYRRV